MQRQMGELLVFFFFLVRDLLSSRSRPALNLLGSLKPRTQDSSASVSQMMKLQVCTTVPSQQSLTPGRSSKRANRRASWAGGDFRGSCAHVIPPSSPPPLWTWSSSLRRQSVSKREPTPGPCVGSVLTNRRTKPYSGSIYSLCSQIKGTALPRSLPRRLRKSQT